MRKQTKLVAVLSAAALLAVGASMTSFAATGWTEEDGTWVYYDKDGYKVENTWKKSGSYWYWLDEDGYMATSKLIENGDDGGNIYYVDETGKMVANRWVELTNENYYDGAEDDNEAETVWYYFQNSGKAYRTSGPTSFKTINGKKYAFDDNGQMLYGWVGPNSDRIKSGDSSYMSGIYYCGDSNDGARVSNDWRKLYVGNTGPSDSEDDEFWFYFQNNGQKVAATYDAAANNGLGAKKYTKKINGKTYGFDDYGIMISEWFDEASVLTVKKASLLDGYYSDTDNGARKKGWFKVIPSEELNSSAYNDDEAKWFYGNNDGSLVNTIVKTINGKKYAFNDKGEMLSGLWALDINNNNQILDFEKVDTEAEVNDIVSNVISGNANFEIYYFGGSDDGAMKTGNQSVEVDGETYQFAFEKNGSVKGQGYNKVYNNVLYSYGKKVKADTDYRYMVADNAGQTWVPTTVGAVTGAQYLINTSGVVMKGSGSYIDSEGREYTVTTNNTTPVTYTVTFRGWKN